MERGENAPARRDVTEYGLRRILIVGGVMLASLMQTLDSTITNVALPTIQGNLGATQEEATWVVTAYTIAAIIVIPITPWLQDRFGRKNYFVGSIVGFTLASIACGASSSLSFLIVSRIVQGAFGGGLLATAQAILRETFPPSQLGASQGIFAIGAIMGPALGPPLGGYLVDAASWNWVFDINVIPGTVAGILLFVLLRDPESRRGMQVDTVGLALLAAGLGSMQYVLTEGEQHYWLADAAIRWTAVICIVSLVGLVWWELRAREPIVDLRIFRNRSVAAGSLLALTLGMAVFGTTYVLPQLTQGPLGFTPSLSGDLFLLRALPIFLATPIVVRLSGKVDPRYLLVFGFLMISLGSWFQYQITTDLSAFWSFTAALVATGIGSAFLFIPLSIAVLGATTPREGPNAGAMVNLSLQLGGSISVALLNVVIDRRWSYYSTLFGANQTLANPQTRAFLAHGSVAQLSRIVNGQAAVAAYADAALVIAVVGALFIPLIFLMRKPQAPAGPVGVGH
ncbi:MAG: DHA2 family efflux MFS transporter permease subunit [Vulcanimicrobiaceae bacterium]